MFVRKKRGALCASLFIFQMHINIKSELRDDLNAI